MSSTLFFLSIYPSSLQLFNIFIFSFCHSNSMRNHKFLRKYYKVCILFESVNLIPFFHFPKYSPDSQYLLLKYHLNTFVNIFHPLPCTEDRQTIIIQPQILTLLFITILTLYHFLETH